MSLRDSPYLPSHLPSLLSLPSLPPLPSLSSFLPTTLSHPPFLSLTPVLTFLSILWASQRPLICMKLLLCRENIKGKGDGKKKRRWDTNSIRIINTKVKQWPTTLWETLHNALRYSYVKQKTKKQKKQKKQANYFRPEIQLFSLSLRNLER